MHNLTHPTLKHPRTGLPLEAAGIVNGKVIWPVLGAEDPPEGGGDPKDGKGEKTFTQAELDAKITERLNRERDETRRKYGDYDELKAKAEGSKTSDDRIAELERQLETTNREALRRAVQASFGISDEDAELYLTGTDRETLERQAKRLQELNKSGAGENGYTPDGRNGRRPKISEGKQVVKSLFG